MPLAPGRRLGPYEIAGPLGAGGMGEVYRARDTRLERTVALKILPLTLAMDPQFRDRFGREARAISQLNHPHICTLHDIGDQEDTLFLVMEHLEGETLAKRLERGALPLADALTIAIQIASALDTAHRAGITHRDIKPANIFLTKNGAKLLDFGLAKTGSAVLAAAGLSTFPTMAPAPTAQGTILGTVQYMAPEQLEAKEADARTDIFAFGAVLYEMLTGTKAFVGKSQASLIAAILAQQPAPPSALQPLTPPALDRLVAVCLAKDPDERWQGAADLGRQLKGIAEDRSQGNMATQAPGAVRRRTVAAPLIAAVAGVAGVLLALAGVWALRERPASVDAQLVTIVVPKPGVVGFWSNPALPFALSPDGSAVVYVGRSEKRLQNEKRPQTHLWLRSLTALAPHELPGTEGGVQPFFSPDGRWVGFFTPDGKLKKVPVAGGNAVTLADKITESQWAFGTWTDDGTIVFGIPTSGLQRVAAEGGAVVAVTTLEASHRAHRGPEFVPATRAVVFTVQPSGLEQPRIEAVMLDSKERRPVLENAHSPHYVSTGHLLFQRGDAIFVAPFDARRLAITGPVEPISNSIRRDGLASEGQTAQLAVSANGTLAFLPAIDESGTIGFVDHTGTFDPMDVQADRFQNVAASPNGQHIAYLVGTESQGRLFVHDRVRGTTRGLTHDGWDIGLGLAWHPNSRALAVSSVRQNTAGLFYKELSGPERLLVPADGSVFKRNMSWSPDGTVLAYTVQSGSRHDIWTVTLGDNPHEQPLLNGPSDEHTPRFSPDGHWLAYVSNEGGVGGQVWVTKYPKGDPMPVSTGSGGPVWSRDGKALYFQLYGAESKMMKVAVELKGDSIEIGKPQPLFNFRVPGPADGTVQYAISGNRGPRYDVLPDGRFVMIRRVEQETREIVLVQHWFEEVKRLFQTR